MYVNNSCWFHNDTQLGFGKIFPQLLPLLSRLGKPIVIKLNRDWEPIDQI